MKLGDSLGRSRRGRRKDSSEGDSNTAEAAAPTESGAPGNGPAALLSWLGGVRSRLNGRNLVIGVVGLVAVGWLFGYVLATQVVFPAPPPPGDLFDVPDLRGLGIASASERLAGAGLELGVTDSLQHPTVAAGLVLGQSPLPGQVARPDMPVRVTVSMGPQSRAVPDVLGLDEASARVVLETSGFVVNVVSTQAEAPRGSVIQISPRPGSTVDLPAEISLVVSAGPPVVSMPLVLGLERAAAESMLDSLGLVVSDVEEVFRFGRDQGIVVEQEPTAETELRRGSSVRLKVGRRGAGGNNDPHDP